MRFGSPYIRCVFLTRFHPIILSVLAGLGAALAFLMPVVAGAQNQPRPPVSLDDVPIAMLVDMSSGQVLYARERGTRFVPASITKAMTLFLAFELIEQGALDPNQSMTMSDATFREWGGRGSTLWINARDTLRVDQLLMGIANVSANDGSILLAQGHAGSVAAWTDAMNEKAAELGMLSSHFGTPNGWPDEGRTFTTAADLVILGQALVERHRALFDRYVGRPGYTFNGITQPNRDPLIGQFRGADGIKTGYTNESGFGYLGTAQRADQRLVMVVAGIERGRSRAVAARDLMEWGFSAFDRQRLFSAGETIDQASVQGGAARSVGLTARQAIWVNVPTGSVQQPRLTIDYNGPLRAPIAKGEQIATLQIDVDGMEPARIPLYADDNIGEAGLLDRIFNAIIGWLS